MHILFIPSWYPTDSVDAGASFFREQTLALHKHSGYKVGVISTSFDNKTSVPNWLFGTKEFDSYDDEGVFVVRSKLPSGLRRLSRLSVEIWLMEGLRLFRDYVKENGVPDILHAHVMFNGGLLANRISKHFGIKFVITEHYSGYALGRVKKWQMRLAKKAALRASACVAVSEKFCNLLDEVYEFESGSWRYVPNFIPDLFFSTDIHKIKPNNHNFTLCNVSLLSKNKGVDRLVKAFASSNSINQNTQLVVVGKGPELDNLKKLAKELAVTNSVRFLGDVGRDSIIGVISECDVLVVSSLYETFGIVLIEALALGKPVIATKCGGPESIVTDNNGILVDGTVSQLTKAIDKMHDTIGNYDAESLRRNCYQKFGAPIVVYQIQEIYESISKQYMPKITQ